MSSGTSQLSTDEENASDVSLDSDPNYHVGDSQPNTAYDDDPIAEATEEEVNNMQARDEDGLEPQILEARYQNRISVQEWSVKYVTFQLDSE